MTGHIVDPVTRRFSVYGKDYEGEDLSNLIPGSHSGYGDPDVVRHLRRYIEEGGKVYLEITSGARKGTVGRLNLTPEMLTDCYEDITAGSYNGKRKRVFADDLEVVFDDRKQTIKLDMYWYSSMGWPDHKITFLPETTTWVYTTKPRPKEVEWTPKDFFGNVISKDSLVFFSDRDGVHRVGQVQRWTNKGTMWVKANSEIYTHGVIAHEMILLDAFPDLKSAAVLKKLTAR